MVRHGRIWEIGKPAPACPKLPRDNCSVMIIPRRDVRGVRTAARDMHLNCVPILKRPRWIPSSNEFRVRTGAAATCGHVDAPARRVLYFRLAPTRVSHGRCRKGWTILISLSLSHLTWIWIRLRVSRISDSEDERNRGEAIRSSSVYIPGDSRWSLQRSRWSTPSVYESSRCLERLFWSSLRAIGRPRRPQKNSGTWCVSTVVFRPCGVVMKWHSFCLLVPLRDHPRDTDKLISRVAVELGDTVLICARTRICERRNGAGLPLVSNLTCCNNPWTLEKPGR